MTTRARTRRFHGWRVVAAAFVLALFGLGAGFHGPAIYLHAVHQRTGWPLGLISTAVSAHFLLGALVVGHLPVLYARFGVPAVTKAGAFGLAVGVLGWATAAAPWQLFGAALLSGTGWGAMSLAAVNAIVSPWFARARPAALAMAYNGGGVGGILFPPLWAAAIPLLGFPVAAAAIGLVMTLVIWGLADRVFSQTPQGLGLAPDGTPPEATPPALQGTAAKPLPGSLLWRDRRFLTLAAGMSLGLFAQIGLVMHLFSLLVPALGAQRAGLAMALVTTMAIAGRSFTGWLMPLGADRRLVACLGYAVQIAGSLAFAAAAGTNVALLLLGVVLFGAGFGNGTWLPPLIAQAEFAEAEVPRVAALVIAIAQAIYAFAPASFGLVRALGADAAGGDAAPGLFLAAALVQGLAITTLLAGRRRRLP